MISVPCDDCRDVEVEPESIQVRVCTVDGTATYSFCCPICSMRVVRPAESRTVDVLVQAGAAYVTWAPPLELSEQHAGGGPVKEDEVDHLGADLANDATVAQAYAAMVQDLTDRGLYPRSQQE